MNCYKGLFWLIDERLICKRIRCDLSGIILDSNEMLTAINGKNDNHKIVWDTLPHSVTHGKSYNYYPRGRVEIRNGVAVIFLNPQLCTDDVIEMVKTEFYLSDESGIKDVKIKADGSKHYRCCLDT